MSDSTEIRVKRKWLDPRVYLPVLAFFGISGTALVKCGRDVAGVIVLPTITSAAQAESAKAMRYTDKVADSIMLRVDKRLGNIEDLILEVPQVKAAQEAKERRDRNRRRTFGRVTATGGGP